MNAAIATLRTRVLAEAERRLPALTRLRQPEALPVRLDRRRIYVLPTGFGVALTLLLFVMLVGALNYGNNPALLLTCLLGATCGASLFAGFRVLSGLGLVMLHAGEAHAGDVLALRLRFDGNGRARPSLRLRCAGIETAAAIPASTGEVVLPLRPQRRGWFRPGRIRIWSEYPLGLFDVWSWVNPDQAFLVLPALESPAPPLPGGAGDFGEQSRMGASEEHSGLRDYRSSDPSKLIAWKASVRHDTLLVRDTEWRAGEALTLDYAQLHELGHEARISRLATWVLAAEAIQATSTLRLPSETIGPGSGATHRIECLRALALMPDAHGTPAA